MTKGGGAHIGMPTAHPDWLVIGKGVAMATVGVGELFYQLQHQRLSETKLQVDVTACGEGVRV